MSRDRSLVLALAAVGAAALVAPSVLSAGKRVVFNTTASAPIGFYWLEHRAPAIGDLAVVRPPAALAAWMARRRYLPLNVPLLKGVVATAGTQVCVVDERVFVAGRIVAVARTRDRWGRRQPLFRTAAPPRHRWSRAPAVDLGALGWPRLFFPCSVGLPGLSSSRPRPRRRPSAAAVEGGSLAGARSALPSTAASTGASCRPPGRWQDLRARSARPCWS